MRRYPMTKVLPVEDVDVVIKEEVERGLGSVYACGSRYNSGRSSSFHASIPIATALASFDRMIIADYTAKRWLTMSERCPCFD